MRILLFGKNGQVGWELQRSLAPLGEVLALERKSVNYCGDLSDPEGLFQTILTYKPDFIVNAAGYTSVDSAELEPNLARSLNVNAPAVMAKAAAKIGAWLVHYSTDYVFDGSGEHARQEGEGVGPLNVYGQTKQEAEQAIVVSGCKYVIFRTSWVYAAYGENFPKTILRLALDREKLSVIDNQFGAPTGADLVADITAHAIRHISKVQNVAFCGLYHLCASGYTNWHEYACAVLEIAKTNAPQLTWKVKEVVPVSAAQFAAPAIRPMNSRLCTNKLQQTFGLHLPFWRLGVERTIAELLKVKII